MSGLRSQTDMESHEEEEDRPHHTLGSSKESHGCSSFLIQSVIVASIGGCLLGYDLGVVSAALPQLSIEFNLSDHELEMVVSFLYLGSGLGALLGGQICDKHGRKKAILFTDIVFILGALILFTAKGLSHLLLGRFVVGFGVAVSGLADVSYLHEISPVELRGSIVSVNEICISGGFLASYLVGYYISIANPNDGWRVMFGASGLIALVQFAGMLMMPESPVWLQEQGYFDAADRAFERIHGLYVGGFVSIGSKDEHGFDLRHENIPRVIPIQQNNLESSPEETTNPTTSTSIRSTCESIYLDISIHYRQAIIATFLSVMQQFSGNIVVLNFAPMLFAQLGFQSAESTLIVTCILGGVKFLVTAFVIWKIESVGRRFLLLLGMVIISISLLFLTIAFSGTNYVIADDDVAGDDNYVMSTMGQYIAIVGVFGVAIGYSASYGPLTWLLVSELFPSSIRGRAIGISSIITAGAASVIPYTFLSFKNIDPSLPFVLYFVLTTLSIGFAKLAIPNTADKEANEIEDEMKKMWWWRKRLQSDEIRHEDTPDSNRLTAVKIA